MSFAIYPSLKDAVVYITGGASGIGADMVRAFAEQESRVGFVDIAEEGRTARSTNWPAPARRSISSAATCATSRRCKAAFAELKAAIGPAGVLVNNAARDDRHGWAEVTPEYYDERIATNLRHMFFAIQMRRARHDRGRQGIDHQFRLELLVRGGRRHARLHHGQSRGARHDARIRPRSRQAPHPRQHPRPRLGDDGTAEDAVGRRRTRSTATSRANACPTSSSPSMSREWPCSSPPTIRRCARPTTIWSRRGRSNPPLPPSS